MPSEILCSGFSVPAPRSIARQAGVGAARGGAIRARGGAAKQLVTPTGRPLGSSLLLAPRLARLETMTTTTQVWHTYERIVHETLEGSERLLEEEDGQDYR